VQSIDLGPVGQGSRLVSACEDTNGAVWLYTGDARLARYQDGKLDLLKLFKDVPAVSRMVAADRSGLIWISEFEASLTGGVAWLLSFRPENFHPHALAVEQNLQANRIDAILAGKNGGVWRLMDGRVQKWNGRLRDFGPYPWTNATVSAAQVTAVCEDADGNLIVGTPRDGIYWFDAGGDYRHITRDQGLSSNFILSLCLDREGNLWVGTDGGGLNRVKKKIFLSPGNLSPLPAQSVAADATGGLWTAFNANGAACWRGNSVQNYAVGQYENAWAVLVDQQQQVWMGTLGEGLFELQNGQFQRALHQPIPPSSQTAPDIFALFEDRSGQLWVGTQSGLAAGDGQTWKFYTTADGLPENIVRAIAQDPAGNFWIGTESQGLSYLSNGRFSPVPAATNGPPGNDISALCMDRDGVLWVGTAGHGLACLKNGQWTQFSTLNGLPSNSISYIIEDDDGNLWIGSNAGLMRIPKQGGSLNFAALRTFGQPDGLPTRECSIGSEPAAGRASDGKLWFPTAKGLVSVNPAAFKPDTQPPLVMIESVKVDTAEQKTNRLSSAWSQAVVVPPGAEQLEIHYTGLHFTAPQEIRFRYRLAGHETTYTEAGNERVARSLSIPREGGQ